MRRWRCAEPACVPPHRTPDVDDPSTTTQHPTEGKRMNTASSAWEDLVTTALLGTERRTPPGSVPGREAPVALLDAAAVETVRRRAGLRPARAAERPEPAPEDPRPHLPAAAARRLALLLADRPGAGGQAVAEARHRISWSCCRSGSRGPTRAASRRHRRCCPRCWTRLAAVRIYGRMALTFAGPRAMWLARLNPDWRFALRAAPGGARRCRTPKTRRRYGSSGRRDCSLSGSPCSRPSAPACPPSHANCSRPPGRRNGRRTA